jgi:putative effector of murein hydrolase LrgA (UPF0299 family)
MYHRTGAQGSIAFLAALFIPAGIAILEPNPDQPENHQQQWQKTKKNEYTGPPQ